MSRFLFFKRELQLIHTTKAVSVRKMLDVGVRIKILSKLFNNNSKYGRDTARWWRRIGRRTDKTIRAKTSLILSETCDKKYRKMMCMYLQGVPVRSVI